MRSYMIRDDFTSAPEDQLDWANTWSNLGEAADRDAPPEGAGFGAGLRLALALSLPIWLAAAVVLLA